MDKPTLTSEQEQVICHPLGAHARVLAVAGSGKSTTLSYRVHHLVTQERVPPASIRILMYNALARKEFAARLAMTGLPPTLQPEVHTFHSFSFKVIQSLIHMGVLPEILQFWIGDKEELVWLTLKRAIRNLEKNHKIPPDTVDPEQALHTISLWKGALLPPDRAGTTISPYLPLVYAEFERLRLEKAAITFDDFIPLALDILQANPRAQMSYSLGVQHVLVDEYQDVNFGQQKLIEVLAGGRADVMVVGDDDQTIYEWRGARPNYILQDFMRVFNNKPHHEYCLSHSFRFGPAIAQAAANVIVCNSQRVSKKVVAHDQSKAGFIHVFNGGFTATHNLADQVLAFRLADQVPPLEVAVLARMYSQMDDLEAEFLNRGIPYRVEGQEPFFNRSEIRILLDYIRLTRVLAHPIHRQAGIWLLSVANKPFRMLSSALLDQLIQDGERKRLTLLQTLDFGCSPQNRGFNPMQRASLGSLRMFLIALTDKLAASDEQAGNTLQWMLKTLDYLAYFQDYYGPGEHADEKRQAVLNFVEYVSYLHLSSLQLLDHIAHLDTTRGVPREQQIVFTTIHRTKGTEYDFVILPHCDEEVMPYLKGERSTIFDLQGIFQETPTTSPLENERRLFYVGLTRARCGVLIGTSSNPSRFLAELGTPQVVTA